MTFPKGGGLLGATARAIADGPRVTKLKRRRPLTAKIIRGLATALALAEADLDAQCGTSVDGGEFQRIAERELADVLAARAWFEDLRASRRRKNKPEAP